ncbi:DUF6596 domain-containing protein [Streptomyces lydicus]|uniref:DUF6596 domain-containing protein n=1 Tax=Streptomyces lydicus TaxID=47763 RepID=UPI003717C722
MRAETEWPGGRKVVALVTVALEMWSPGHWPAYAPMAAAWPLSGIDDTHSTSWAGYGVTTGIWRLLDVLGDLPATIVRAKKKIRQARIPFRVPGADELPERLPGVLQVLYSIFTEGYAASSGPQLQRIDLAEEAIRLARILHRLMPAAREVHGLLGLMLLIHARHEARTGPDGELVLLEDQDRSRWDHMMIKEGCRLAVSALTGGPPGPYGVQAAIAALHDEAPDLATTDWPQVVALYDVLLALAPSPVVELNRAVAVALRDGPQAGLALLDGLAGEPRLRGHHPYPAARGDLLHRLGRLPGAAAAYREALDLVGTEPERAHLRRRLHTIEPPGPGDRADKTST